MKNLLIKVMTMGVLLITAVFLVACEIKPLKLTQISLSVSPTPETAVTEMVTEVAIATTTPEPTPITPGLSGVEVAVAEPSKTAIPPIPTPSLFPFDLNQDPTLILYALAQEGSWALKAYPDALAFTEPVFQTFYGPVSRLEDARQYTHFNFSPQLSPNGRYLLLPGIGGYSGPGTGAPQMLKIPGCGLSTCKATRCANCCPAPNCLPGVLPAITSPTWMTIRSTRCL
ncbi:MAG: hypothetical protein M5U34_34070 [Chloroflexi bacterium]|nr:hypothetical protein [Chloroflexota bacterium]